MKRATTPAIHPCIFLGAAILLMSTLPATPSAAAETSRALIVPHHDLDLSRRADVARLEHRLAHAARSICRRPGYSIEAVLSHRRCTADSLTRARAVMAQLVAENRSPGLRVGGTRPVAAR